MYLAAIVDDENTSAEYLKSLLKKALTERGLNTAFDLFPSGESFLSMLNEHYHFDMIFMDIEMPGLNGIEVSRRINALSPEALIIFVSSRGELVFDTFSVHPFRFLPKDQLEKRIPELCDALSTELHRRNDSVFRFSDATGDIYSFSMQNIVYIEARNKDCRIVTTDGDSLVHLRLMDLEEQLPEDMFLKIHRSYLVNAAYILLIEKKTVSLTTKEELPLARNRADEVRDAFLKYIRS